MTQKVEILDEMKAILDAMGVFFARPRSRDVILLEVGGKKQMTPHRFPTLGVTGLPVCPFPKTTIHSVSVQLRESGAQRNMSCFFDP